MGYGIAIDQIGEVDLYRFGRSKQIFRGPRPNLKRPYVAFIGGSEPFGKFVSVPFPKLVQKYIHVPCVNWGTPSAGPGFFLKDPVLLEACSNAEACVVQAMDPVALSNRMYSVFPRRNTRLRGVSESLRALFPDVEFDDYKYVPALMRKLRAMDEAAFRVVVAEQKSAWVARMLELLEDIETRKVLLWLDTMDGNKRRGLVTEEMVEVLRARVDRVVRVPVAAKRGRVSGFAGGRDPAWMTRGVHAQVATEVSEVLKEMLAEGVVSQG